MSQTSLLLEMLSDGKEHRTDEIMKQVYGSEHLGAARIGARVNDLKKAGYEITKARQDKEIPSLYWYKMVLRNTNGVIIN